MPITYYKLPLVLGLFFLILAGFGCPTRIGGGYEVKNDQVIFHEGMKGLGSTRNFPV